MNLNNTLFSPKKYKPGNAFRILDIFFQFFPFLVFLISRVGHGLSLVIQQGSLLYCRSSLHLYDEQPRSFQDIFRVYFPLLSDALLHTFGYHSKGGLECELEYSPVSFSSYGTVAYIYKTVSKSGGQYA